MWISVRVVLRYFIRKDSHIFSLEYTGTLKDLNFTAEILLSSSEERDLLMQQLRSDVHFLTKHNIMDYSLLLGIMFMQSDLPWRTSDDSMDLMPHKSVSARTRNDTADKAYLRASVLRAYTSRKVMATLLPEVR